MGYPDLRRLAVCRNLLKDEIINKLIAVQIKEQNDSSADTEAADNELQRLRSELAALLIKKAETLGLSGDILSTYLTYCLAEGNNTAAETIEATGAYGKGLTQATAQDMQLLLPYLSAKRKRFHHDLSGLLPC